MGVCGSGMGVRSLRGSFLEGFLVGGCVRFIGKMGILGIRGPLGRLGLRLGIGIPRGQAGCGRARARVGIRMGIWSSRGSLEMGSRMGRSARSIMITGNLSIEVGLRRGCMRGRAAFITGEG